MPRFMVTHPSTIYTVVEAPDAWSAKMIAHLNDEVAWHPSDDVILDLDEIEAEEVE